MQREHFEALKEEDFYLLHNPDAPQYPAQSNPFGRVWQLTLTIADATEIPGVVAHVLPRIFPDLMWCAPTKLPCTRDCKTHMRSTPAARARLRRADIAQHGALWP